MSEIPAEFQALPLEYLIAAPLKGVINAQRIAAETTQQFIESMIDDEGNPTTVEFEASQSSTNEAGDLAKNKIKVTAPLLSIIPIPHLRIDSYSSTFRFEVKQTWDQKKAIEWGAETSLKVGGNPFVKGSIAGSVSSKISEESTMNRSGSIEITVNASESLMPKGLEKIMNILTESITSEPVVSAKPKKPANK